MLNYLFCSNIYLYWIINLIWHHPLFSYMRNGTSPQGFPAYFIFLYFPTIKPYSIYTYTNIYIYIWIRFNSFLDSIPETYIILHVFYIVFYVTPFFGLCYCFQMPVSTCSVSPTGSLLLYLNY